MRPTWEQHIPARADEPHPTCLTHRSYGLSCAEFDDLRRTNPGRCHMCGTETDVLNIDHDHSVGGWAVRGLLCDLCNPRLAHMERGLHPLTPDAVRFLANAWHLRQPSSAGKKRRASPRGDCPVCGLNCALRKDGSTATHWSRLPGENDTCLGGPPKTT